MRLLTTSLLVLSGLAAGCGNNSFSGGGSKAPGTSAPKAEEKADPPAPATEPKGDEVDQDATAAAPESGETAENVKPKAILECLKDWPNHPFSDAELAAPTEATVSQSNNNNAGSFKDDEVTDKPKLILVTVTSKNVNSGGIQLLNPKGWYCVDVQSQNANNFTVVAACGAEIATLSHTEHVAHAFQIERDGACN